MRIRLFYSLSLLAIFFLISCETSETKTENKEVKDSITNEMLWNNYIEWLDKQSFVKFEDDKDIFPNYEKNRDTVLLRQFVDNYYDSVIISPFKDAQIIRSNTSELVQNLYTIDFNGDNQLDVFYRGGSGGGELVTQIFLSQNNQYKKVFMGYQNITNIQFVDDKLTSFILLRIGCCTDIQVVNYFYSVTYNDSIPNFTLVKAEGYLDGTELVKNKFPTPKNFHIAKDGVKLRSCAYIIDAPHPGEGNEGNILARYESDAEGIAFGSKIDGEKKWIYVKMLSKPSFCDWTTFKEQPTELYGWILEEEVSMK